VPHIAIHLRCDLIDRPIAAKLLENLQHRNGHDHRLLAEHCRIAQRDELLAVLAHRNRLDRSQVRAGEYARAVIQ
jgi:hypothetical protein